MELRKSYQSTGKYFEDFNIGDKFVTPSRTITEADIVNFTGVSGDYSPVHTDAVFARERGFPSIIAHGLLTLAVASALRLRTGIFDGTALALMGVDARFMLPVFPGDTITCALEVIEKRLTQTEDRGVVKMKLRAFKQTGEQVLEVIYTTMNSCRPR